MRERKYCLQSFSGYKGELVIDIIFLGYVIDGMNTTCNRYETLSVKHKSMSLKS